MLFISSLDHLGRATRTPPPTPHSGERSKRCKLGRKMRRGNKRCVLVRRGESAVAVIVPSPLAGEGGSMLPQTTMGKGWIARTPHPFDCAGRPLRPLPQGERARAARVTAVAGAATRAHERLSQRPTSECRK